MQQNDYKMSCKIYYNALVAIFRSYRLFLENYERYHKRGERNRKEDIYKIVARPRFPIKLCLIYIYIF